MALVSSCNLFKMGQCIFKFSQCGPESSNQMKASSAVCCRVSAVYKRSQHLVINVSLCYYHEVQFAPFSLCLSLFCSCLFQF